MTDDEIKGLFSFYGQYVSGKDYALIRAIEKVTSPQRTWVGLTDEEVITMSKYDLQDAALIGEVHRKLKERNT
jgi:hypothetical protein